MKKLLLVILAVTLFKLVLSPVVWHPDINNHVDWGIRFWQYGPAKFFLPETNVWSYTWPNQPPGTIYLFGGIRKLYEGTFAFLSYLHFNLHAFPGSFLLYLEKNMYSALLKLPAILADAGIAYLVYFIVKDITKKEKPAFWAAVVWMVNPVIWYNSAVWGQYDSVINFLALLSFYLLTKRKLASSLLALVFCLYIKASLLIFVPIYLIIAVRQKYKLIEYVKSILISAVPIALVTLPFSQGEPFSWLLNLYTNKVFGHQLQVITANAFNIWSMIAGIHERPQTLPFFGLTYQYWSYIIFSVFYLPVLWLVYKKQDMKSVVWGLGIAAFSSFMLLTNMHERYLYPLFPYFTVLVVVYPELFANYIAVSVINLLNLYNFWWVPFVWSLVDFMSARNRLAPRILGGVNFMLFVFLYMRFIRYNFIKK